MHQQIVIVVALNSCWWKRYAVTSSVPPARMYVDEIMIFRPTLSNSGPRIQGPSRLPTANGMMYSGAFAFYAWKNVFMIDVIPNSVAL
jgi:hypothetical protein